MAAVIDFARSFVTFRIDTSERPPTTVSHPPAFTVNNARVVLDCQCAITEKTTKRTETFVLGASCKTERVGVDRNIWTQPNADFVPVFSALEFMHIKTYDRVGRAVERYPPSGGRQPERQVERNSDAFDRVDIDIHFLDGQLLDGPDAIIASTLRNDPLVARTELENDSYRAVIDYPVKTMNVSPVDRIYQADTGPVLLPDLNREWGELIEGFELAFCAFNTDSWVEFLVRCENPIADNVRVYHYSRAVRFDPVHNQVFRLESP